MLRGEGGKMSWWRSCFNFLCVRPNISIISRLDCRRIQTNVDTERWTVPVYHGSHEQILPFFHSFPREDEFDRAYPKKPPLSLMSLFLLPWSALFILFREKTRMHTGLLIIPLQLSKPSISNMLDVEEGMPDMWHDSASVFVGGG